MAKVATTVTSHLRRRGSSTASAASSSASIEAHVAVDFQAEFQADFISGRYLNVHSTMGFLKLSMGIQITASLCIKLLFLESTMRLTG